MQHITHVENSKETECGEGSSRGKKWKDETLRKGRRVFGNAKKVIRKGERARKQEKGRNGETEISEED